MHFNISQLFCFKDEGPAILCDIVDTNNNAHQPNWAYKFKSLRGKNGTRREFTVPRSGLENATYVDTNFCNWIEDEELSKVKRGDEVFVFLKGRINLAEFRGINDDGLAEVWMHSDRQYPYYVHPVLIIYYTHQYKSLGGGVKGCHCGRMVTPKYKPKEKGIKHGKINS